MTLPAPDHGQHDIRHDDHHLGRPGEGDAVPGPRLHRPLPVCQITLVTAHTVVVFTPRLYAWSDGKYTAPPGLRFK